MKAKWVVIACLMQLVVAMRLPAQQSEADNKLFEQIKAKADKGDAWSECAIGEAYSIGRIVPEDPVEAVKWFRKAADQGVAEAEYNLGVCYQSGNGVSKDFGAMARWFRVAAEKGYVLAEYNLGVSYGQGNGVPIDYDEAVKWYRKAAEQGDADAQYDLGVCYQQGFGVHKDYGEMVKWYRKAAEQSDATAQWNLGLAYQNGMGVPVDYGEMINWCRKAADQGEVDAQFYLGVWYEQGFGVKEDHVEALKWYRKAAEQNSAMAQIMVAQIYANGEGVPQDYAESVKWYRKAADQGNASAEYSVGNDYYRGFGVITDYVEAYKWLNLASAQTDDVADTAKKSLSDIAQLMTPEQIAQGQQLSREFSPSISANPGSSNSPEKIVGPKATGTGFFITEDGYFVTNDHVVNGASQIRLVTSEGIIDARVVNVDTANDLALLKAVGRFAPLPITMSRSVKLGNTVATVGFPDTGLQGFSPKLAKGEIASLSGMQDDPRYFQISVPVQPGNSGGALVDEHGNVVGVVSAKLNASMALAVSGALPENVNYAVKSSFLLSFLESTPDVSAKLKDPVMVDRKFEDTVKSAQDATVLVLVY